MCFIVANFTDINLLIQMHLYMCTTMFDIPHKHSVMKIHRDKQEARYIYSSTKSLGTTDNGLKIPCFPGGLGHRDRFPYTYCIIVLFLHVHECDPPVIQGGVP